MSLSSINNFNFSDFGTQWPVHINDYKIIKCIGQGTTSFVYEAYCVPLSKKCAMKMINLDKSNTSISLDEINREIISMKNMKNENVVTYYSSFVDDTKLYIVMEFCQRGSLLDVIKFMQNARDVTYGVFDECTIATILRDVLHGLSYIHENGLVHRDLKCGNLLVKDNGVIEIADFGVAGLLATQPLAATASIDIYRYTFVGTPCWMAPEVMQQVCGYNQKADIWSIGITTIEMATGQAPYSKQPPLKVLMLTLQNNPPTIETVATFSNQYANYGQKFRKFTQICLFKDPSLRPTSGELLNHHFIKMMAKDRDLLCRVLVRGEFPEPPIRVNRPEEAANDNGKQKPNNNLEWNFDTLRKNSQISHSSYNEKKNNRDFQTEIYMMHTHKSNTMESTSNSRSHLPMTPPCTPTSSSLFELNAIQNLSISKGNPKDSEITEPYFRLTLRKRNPNCKNELQDISFNYVPGKDTAEVMSRELVDAGLLNGCDSLIVAHHMSELMDNPSEGQRVFLLNSPIPPGKIPTEDELYGYAKIMIHQLKNTS